MQEREAGQGGVDLAAPKALAEKATKGKLWAAIWYKEADAHFIAACDPDTILALIAEVEAARERRCETCAEWGWDDDGDHYCDGLDRRTAPDFGCNQWRKGK